MKPAEDPRRFILEQTAVAPPPLVPEVRLHLASEAEPLWQATEDVLAARDLPPPYWAFAWAGGQALARYLLDRPEVVAGKRVLDLASGSGLVAIAAVRAGAGRVEAAEIDRFAAAAITLNTALNDVEVETVTADLVGRANPGWDVVLAGDVCYEQPMAERVTAWLGDLAAGGTEVLLGDPGRSYLPKAGLERITGYSVQTTRELEDSDVKNTVVWRVMG